MTSIVLGTRQVGDLAEPPLCSPAGLGNRTKGADEKWKESRGMSKPQFVLDEAPSLAGWAVVWRVSVLC